jgi:hypothetical protein
MGPLLSGRDEGAAGSRVGEPFGRRNIYSELVQLGYVLRSQGFRYALAVLLGCQPAVDQGLTERSERTFAIFVRRKPPGALIIPGHVAQDIATP